MSTTDPPSRSESCGHNQHSVGKHETEEAKASQDLFVEAIFRNFGDIPHFVSQRDGILIGGASLEDHNKT